MAPLLQDEKKKGAEEESREVKKKSDSGKTPKATASTPKSETRTESVYAGIPNSQQGVSTMERTVPEDEPPALPPNEQLKHVGKRVTRIDGKFKVTGAAKYPSDLALPGMLYAKMVSSSVPHARVVSVDTAAAEQHPGVKAVHVLERILLSAEIMLRGSA